MREFEVTHDDVLLVGDATPTDWTHRCMRHADEVLVLMHDAGTALPSSTSRWLARIQSRNAVGRVPAGGGARGFAHLGVYRALCEHDIEFDEMSSGWAMPLDRLRPRKSRRYRRPSLPALLINATILYSRSRQKQARALTDLYFNPPPEHVGMLDWRRFDRVVRQGHAHALQVLAEQGPAPCDPP